MDIDRQVGQLSQLILLRLQSTPPSNTKIIHREQVKIVTIGGGKKSELIVVVNASAQKPEKRSLRTH